MRLGLIGQGAIAGTLIEALSRALDAPLERLAVLVRTDALAAARQRFAPLAGRLAKIVNVSGDLTAFLAEPLDLVVECASHAAVAEYGAAILGKGVDLVIASVGALCDPDLHQCLVDAARDSGARMVLTAGAIGGLDILAAARIAGIERVAYTGRKPPLAWLGTPAERRLNLANLQEAVTFYDGDARGAARDFPKNANVAATLALAGAGFEATRVRLVADPAAPGNVHEFVLTSACADVEIRIVGKPSPANPKTSLSTAHALAREVVNRMGPVAI